MLLFPFAHRWHFAAALALLLACAGCFTVDGTVHADGSGTVLLHYRFLPEHATEASERRRFAAPGIAVESIVPDDDGVALTAEIRDVTQIGDAEGFAGVRVTHDQTGADERLRILIDNRRVRQASHEVWPDPADFPDSAEKLPAPRVRITLPGPVASTNRAAVVQGRTVTWTFPMSVFSRERWTKLAVRYRLT